MRGRPEARRAVGAIASRAKCSPQTVGVTAGLGLFTQFRVGDRAATGEPAFALEIGSRGSGSAFLEKRHSDAKAALVACLDAERWAQADVTPERQSRLDRLSQGLTNDEDDTVSDVTPPARDKRSLRAANVEGRTYKCVWSGLVLLDRILDALGAAAAFL